MVISLSFALYIRSPLLSFLFVVNSKPLVQSNINKSEIKVQWQPTLCNPSNNSSNNLSVNINFNEANNKKYGREEQNKQEICYPISVQQ
jgi:hypothetical protein